MKYMKIAFCLVLVLAQYTVYGVERREQPLKPFDELRVFGPYEVVLIPGNEEKMVIHNYNMDWNDILYHEKEGKLKLKFRTNKRLFENPSVRVEIHYKQLHVLSLGASANVSTRGTLDVSRVEVSVASGAFADLELSTGKAKIQVNSGGELVLTGKAATQDASVSSGGVIRASRLQCQSVFVKAVTGGSAYVYAVDNLDAKSSTGGEVKYKGRPKSLWHNANLGGTIQGG